MAGVRTWAAFYDKYGRMPLSRRVRRVRAPPLAFWQPASSARPIAVPTTRPSSRAALVESAAIITPARDVSQADVPTCAVRLTGESPPTGKKRGHQKDGVWSSRQRLQQ
uniref:Uncharacterized protein LOC104210663 n=1 Tax=Nicotiana sylvestris TaxID=4096 RepID=A0A1U7UUM9_NICSY|nr:PREDICTED: uncharacterized protein LOC104210663 [Nicotiana sylvestris]